MQAQQGDNLLQILNQNSQLSKQACRNGNCRICRCRLTSGEIDYQNKIPIALSQDDINNALILPCLSTLISDIEITDLNLLPKKKK